MRTSRRVGGGSSAGYDRAMLAGDSERERAAATLREQYVRGCLTLDELAGRTERVLAARSRADLRRALSGLPILPDLRELAAQGRAAGQAALHTAALVLFTGAYLIFCLVLVVVLGFTLLLHGATTSELVAFLLIWLVPTFFMSRLWHSRPAHRRRGA
jgi:Flp pilus assembly protein TadB